MAVGSLRNTLVPLAPYVVVPIVPTCPTTVVRMPVGDTLRTTSFPKSVTYMLEERSTTTPIGVSKPVLLATPVPATVEMSPLLLVTFRTR